jgi:hypothetical protein
MNNECLDMMIVAIAIFSVGFLVFTSPVKCKISVDK